MSRSSKPTRIGADIGGTFTDLQILDARSGAIVSHEVATTPTDPSIGLMGGFAEAAARFGFALDDVGYLLHGTTTATNVVLERKFPSGALVATASLPALVAMAADLVAQGGRVSPPTASPPRTGPSPSRPICAIAARLSN